ncbi:XrtV sorting system accessory protein [Hyphococcus sp.]|uniref:XrtV sorting system accessory protein n=1 Tax=Hyphococcus sp. TaxID=2038636 RepID=UPI003CCC0AA9
METMFDFLSVLLLIAATGLFVVRIRYEDPPPAPYLLIALVAIVGAWLGNNGGGPAAVALMMASAFLALQIASQPLDTSPDDAPGHLA